jgi:dTDP-4-dehydrorhamnose 3,5-epimerase
MQIKETKIKGLLEIEPTVFGDSRGWFFESFRESWLEKLNIEGRFLQDNESLSNKGVLRGLHFQVPPFAQGKLVRVITGSVLDVAVDIRKDSETFGQHVSVILSGDNKKQFWIPPGFAHGFLVLEDRTIFSYRCTSYYNKEAEKAIRWNDPDLNIDWGELNPILSEKDFHAPFLKDFKSPF